MIQTNNTTVNLPVTSGQKRTRSERVAAVVVKPSWHTQWWQELCKENKLALFFLVVVSVIVTCYVIGAWNPPLGYRPHTVPQRNIVCQTEFSVPDEDGRRMAMAEARAKLKHYFVNEPESLNQLRQAMSNEIASLVNADSYEKLPPTGKTTWGQFLMPDVADTETPSNPKDAFDKFRSTYKALFPTFQNFEMKLARAFGSMEKNGLLIKLDYSMLDGDQEQILVYGKGGDSGFAVPVRVSDALIGDGTRFLTTMSQEFKMDSVPKEHSDDFARALYQWLRPQLGKTFKGTLREDLTATNDALRQAVNNVPVIMVPLIPGQSVLVAAGEPIDTKKFEILREEHREYIKKLPVHDKVVRFISTCALLITLFILAWAFIYRRERRKPKTLGSAASLLSAFVGTIVVGRTFQLFTSEVGQWELVPLLLFVQCIAIMYSWEFALVLTLMQVIVFSIADGGGIGIPIILLGTTASVATQLGRLRTRNKLVIVGAIGGCVAFILTILVGMIEERPLDSFLLWEAGLNIFWSVMAGFIMSGLLPFIERPFGIMTDMSLLELGDVSHPLLQELVHRAPATYSHSMQVGTIAEAAADTIGARGLMTRVGAYFHDIGKIFKPEYFAENQGSGSNLHSMLEPRMSTLVIVAHVKDGADLARQHRLPKALIDLIEQHHGTSLVSFFYGRAMKLSKEAGNGDIEEGTFRYPGPKPQSKEAVILMIADASESACRSMEGNSPGKIESMVRQITKQKLEDGQFDESGLTLSELKTVENSIINSLIAIKHGRIRYPGQEVIEARGEQLDVERGTGSGTVGATTTMMPLVQP
jgi:putative nucleotidyltransferase with HDIG domain